MHEQNQPDILFDVKGEKKEQWERERQEMESKQKEREQRVEEILALKWK